MHARRADLRRAETRNARPTVALAFALSLLAAPLGAQDQGSFEATIRSQLDAFLAHDVEGAFSYAAPGIQQVFRTPENFGMMVENGYPMVWQPGETTFLEQHPKRGGIWQKVMIRDAEGRLHVLDYERIDTPDGPRIGAVEVLEQPDVGA